MRTRFAVAFALAAAAALAAPASADEKPKAAPAGEKAQAAPAGMPSQEEMMKTWMAVATPGDAHKKLEPLVGTFTAKTKAWMEPGKPPQETEGTSENRWVLGNRFIEQHIEAQMMNQPFSGIGYTGYDNYKKKYVGTWMDSMGTMIMNSTGTMDASGKKLTSWSTVDDIIMKKPSKMKSLLTILDNDHHTFEMWGPAPDGKVFKVLEVSYTRKK
jgi:hypothetical protein